MPPHSYQNYCVHQQTKAGHWPHLSIIIFEKKSFNVWDHHDHDGNKIWNIRTTTNCASNKYIYSQ